MMHMDSARCRKPLLRNKGPQTDKKKNKRRVIAERIEQSNTLCLPNPVHKLMEFKRTIRENKKLEKLRSCLSDFFQFHVPLDSPTTQLVH